MGGASLDLRYVENAWGGWEPGIRHQRSSNGVNKSEHNIPKHTPLRYG